MYRKLVRLVFDNPELNGGGTPPEPVTPDPITPDPVEPDPVTPDPADDPAARVPVAAVKAERVRRQAAEAAAATAREEAAYYRGIAERPAAPVTPQTPTAPEGPPVAPVPPRADQFEDYTDFEQADALYKQADRKYIIDVTKYEMRQEFTSQSQQNQRQQSEAQIIASFNKRLTEEAALDPDIMTLANTFHLPGPNQLPLTGPMQDAIRESDVGPKLLRHFANNRAEVTRLAGMSPVTQLREIGRIEAGIINKPQPVVKHVSNAPDPLKPLGGNGPTDVDDDKIPMSEYLARERLRTTDRQKRR
jgi:hypothetical protein